MTFLCGKCGATFTTKDELGQHVAFQHAPIVACRNCGCSTVRDHGHRRHGSVCMSCLFQREAKARMEVRR